MPLDKKGIEIVLPFMDCNTRRNCTHKECYLLLQEEYIFYKIVAEYEELNEDTGIWDSKRANYRWARKRQNISEVDMSFDNVHHLYSVNIDFTGISSGSGWFFPNPHEAKKVYGQLVNYMMYATKFTAEKT